MISEILTTLTGVALNLFIISSMLSMGMSLTVKQIFDLLRNVRLVVMILVANFILVPALAFVLTLVLPLGEPQKVALILLGACAGAPFLPKLGAMSKGNIPLAVGMMVLLMVVTVFYAPAILPLFLPGVEVDGGAIAQSLIMLMLLPLVIGLVVKWRWSNMADQGQPIFANAANYSLLLVIAAALLLPV